MTSVRLSLLAVSLCLLLGAEPLLAQAPDGAIFRVNSVTATQQRGPVVTMDGAGRAVVLWTDYNQGPNLLAHPRVAGQRFDPQGGRVGQEFVCNEPPFDANSATGVVMQGGAEFVSFWDEGGGFQHFARHYLSTGIPSSEPILIDDSGSHVDYFDYLVGFGGSAAGEFVGVWERASIETNLGTFARWFDREAAPITPEVQLVGAFGDQDRPVVDVVAGPNRSVLVGWVIPGFNEAYWDLHVRVYSVTGDAVGPEFLVSHNIGSPQAGMAWNPLTRNFVVAWRSAEALSGGGFIERILFQPLSPEGQPVTPKPIVVSETGGIPAAVACNVRGYCAVTWFRSFVGIVVKVIRPDGSVVPKEVTVAAVPAYPNWIAYGGNGALMVTWTNDYQPNDQGDIAARRLIASPGDEVCQRVGNAVQCDSGRTGSLPELRLAEFGLSRRHQLLFGDVDGDGRDDPCAVRQGIWRCDTDHEGNAERVLSFAGAATGTPLLGDLNGDGFAEPCSWSAGMLRCDTARNGGQPELTLSYGSRGDSPFLGDLDGDGRDDLCLWSRGLLRCDVGHNGGQNELRITFGQAGDQLLLGDFDGNGTDDPCVARAGKLLCDTAHDGGEAEGTLLLGTPGAPVLMGNLDGV